MDNLFQWQYPVFILLPDYRGLYEAGAYVFIIVLFLLAFSPFFFVAKKWKPVTWWKWGGSIVATFFLHFYVAEEGTRLIGIWLERYVQYADLITQYLQTIYLLGFFASILLSLSPFLSVWFIYHKYTWNRFFVALACALLVLGLNLLYWYWVFITGAQLLIQRFNF